MIKELGGFREPTCSRALALQRIGARVGTLILLALGVMVVVPTSTAQHHDGHPTATSTQVPPPDSVGQRVLQNPSTEPGVVEVELRAQPVRLELLPNVETDVFAYNWRIPGPMLEAYEGDSVIVRFRNDLSDETTVHGHGFHLRFVADGSPFHSMPHGEGFVYAFRLLPGTAGTYW